MNFDESEIVILGITKTMDFNAFWNWIFEGT